MKRLLKNKYLPILAFGAGIVGMVLRALLYARCLDERNLLPAGHPLELLLWVVTAVTLGYLIARIQKLSGSNRYVDNFRPSAVAAVGHILAGAGFLLTALINEPMMHNYLGTIWKLLGIAAGPCLMLAGINRVQGKRPFFVLHMTPCLFLVLHIINHYQLWSGNPQLQDYVFALFGTMTLTFFAFYSAAFDVGSGRRRMHLGMGLAAVYLCLVSLPQTEHLFLNVGGIVWALSDLCTLEPKPRAQRRKEGENANDPS